MDRTSTVATVEEAGRFLGLSRIAAYRAAAPEGPRLVQPT